MKTLHLWLDQWGNKYFARTVAELRNEVGGGAVNKMYRDKIDGQTVHCGYVIGRHWLTRFAPVEI